MEEDGHIFSITASTFAIPVGRIGKGAETNKNVLDQQTLEKEKATILSLAPSEQAVPVALLSPTI